MNNSGIPENYEEWRHCITVDCGLELTPQFILERIAALQNDKDHHTQQFVKLYGRQHLQQVLGWFAQAQKMANSVSK